MEKNFVTWAMDVVLCGGDFMDFPWFVNKTAFDNFEVQIAGNLGEQQYFHQLAWNKQAISDLYSKH